MHILQTEGCSRTDVTQVSCQATLPVWTVTLYSLLRRTFDQSNVGQLLTVYPTALTVRQENHIPGNYDRSGFEKYQLTFESNVHDLGEGSVKECSETREGYKYLCPRALLQRKNKFRNNLVDITQHHHQVGVDLLPLCLSNTNLFTILGVLDKGGA